MHNALAKRASAQLILKDARHAVMHNALSNVNPPTMLPPVLAHAAGRSRTSCCECSLTSQPR